MAMTKEKSMPKILIAGAGSIGTVLGAFLSKQNDIVLLRRQESYPSLPIKVVGVEETSCVLPVETIESLDKDKVFDYVFVTCQAQQTVELTESLVRVIKGSPIIISLQNGVGNYEAIRARFKQNPVVLGTVWWSATLLEKTKVYYHRKSQTILGRIDEDPYTTESHVMKVVRLLSPFFEVQKTDHIELELYRKLALNVVSPVLALVKKPYPQGLKDASARHLAHAMFDEAVNALRPKFESLVDDKLLQAHALLKGEVEIKDQKSSPYSHKVSSQISMEKYGGANSNVESLLLPIVRMGKVTGKSTPTIQNVLNYVVRLPSTYLAHSSAQLEGLLKDWNGCSLVFE